MASILLYMSRHDEDAAYRRRLFLLLFHIITRRRVISITRRARHARAFTSSAVTIEILPQGAGHYDAMSAQILGILVIGLIGCAADAA